jgi:hypothetical protein
MLSLDLSSRLDHVETTPTQFILHSNKTGRWVGKFQDWVTILNLITILNNYLLSKYFLYSSFLNQTSNESNPNKLVMK